MMTAFMLMKVLSHNRGRRPIIHSILVGIPEAMSKIQFFLCNVSMKKMVLQTRMSLIIFGSV